MAIRMPKVPKVRVQAELSLQDGTSLTGQLFVDATSRIQDLMNAPEPFFPFVDDEGVLRLINKNSIIQLTPHD